ncbi:LLM class flavin-dependent oxidoreductase [Ralstonia insidiosa]|uniref:5,10-methylene tetrahydromethanopterin reductase n=1 Tax=Ralstonia insidiosa TaxID=190721 RepID=A0A192A3X4_9RALS|nr:MULTISPECIES: LLM class flavin-dependent oxidoreductase [Ralstonia]ANH76232.1 luciferase-like monooxygenase family protein [Ralstonia insidiosa]ANJ74966.1 5,10-methylene tetrahydromethanopterin reductase [Ralstonia insidiosa]EPX94679.1 N5,N10-methylene tetrahydromethanopterin reductase [Ralstonia sp. AU12-08]KAB0468315.1 LLM class flavin-dependent oxidoreductase [Ralstonia insidiosa]MBY4911017.1 LLM class flavin-dependent oxidoreductase [Ralstonia insidiosa]
MKFSIIYEAQMVDTSRKNEARVFNEIIEQSLLAEQVGFDNVWAVEHTALTQYAHMSAPETFLAFLAGKTTRLGIGHGVVCLPPAMNHPVKVAERIATLDILSGGRVHFGMGKGGTQQEAGTFGYDLAELQPMIEESMHLIPKILKDGHVEHDGKYIKIPSRPIHPSPLQQPHPPLYMACTREHTLVTAGESGIGALVLGFSGPDEIAKKNAIYREAFRNRKAENQVGFRPTEHLAALCAATVLDDRGKARKIGLRGQRFFAESIAYWYQGGPAPTVDEHLSAEDQEALLAKDKEKVVAYLSEEHIPIGDEHLSNYTVAQDAYGTPEDCIRYVQRLLDAGADEILFLFQMGGIPHDVILETIRNIGEHVIPHFRKQGQALRIA